MATKKSAPTSATARLRQDYIRIKHDPVPYCLAEPLPSNILEWHYVVKGPEKSPYEGGYYHGKLVFPREFPFKPPSIYMITPNGRFQVNTRLCLSISDFHPDTWNPAWSVSTILTGLLSFMLETSPTLGSIETTNSVKRQLAVQSGPYNLKDALFCELFPDVVKEINENEHQRAIEMRTAQASQAPNILAASNSNGAIQIPGANHGPGFVFGGNNALTNLVVVLGFAMFAYAVKYVLGSLMED